VLPYYILHNVLGFVALACPPYIYTHSYCHSCTCTDANVHAYISTYVCT